MSEGKYTPGPWEWFSDSYRELNGADLAEVLSSAPYEGMWLSYKRDVSEREANARLIAAAPELLEALQAIVKSLSDQDDEGLIEHSQQMIDARAAIHKAIGDAQ